MADDEDEGVFGGAFEDGHWVWDENTQALLFVSDLLPKPVENIPIQTKAPTDPLSSSLSKKVATGTSGRNYSTGTLIVKEFSWYKPEELELMLKLPSVPFHLMHCDKHKLFSNYIKDIKDIALYTAPINILSPMLINLLHLPTTERFLRALILCCGYYLQIADEMADRMMELRTKVRTPDCAQVENVFRDDLADLRVLVAKEYSIMLIGGADTKKFHHMGPQKKRQSLSDKDARLFETLLRMSVQIVWLALGRQSFNRIELETHRMFKSEIFNNVEHTLKTGYIAQMGPEEQAVLLGNCVRHDKKLNTRSPLMNEVFCDRPIDYRLVGLGVVQYPQITTRLQFLRLITAGAEEKFMESDVTLGIIGMQRSKFDTMLRPITQADAHISKSKSSISKQISSAAHGSKISIRKVKKPIYPRIYIPEKDPAQLYFPPSFPDENENSNPVSDIQHKRWLNRLTKLLGHH